MPRKAPGTKAKSAPKFEKNLEKLEELVEALEEGGLSLDDSLKNFEEGVKLAKRCDEALSAAEKRIEILTKDPEGKLQARPFEENARETSDAEAGDNAEDGDDEAGDSDELLF